MTEPPALDVLDLTAQIVAAHVSNNAVSTEELPTLIRDVFKTLANVGRDVSAEERPQPAVPIRKSIFPDYIVCLEDGKKLKMLKRHLKSAFNLTPEQYRARWSLPADYPMVAPNHSRRRQPGGAAGRDREDD